MNIHYGQSSDLMLQQKLECICTADFKDVLHYEKNSLSVEDKKTQSILESTLTHENCHSKIGLPWRVNNTHLPNNLALAHARLQQLKRKLSRDAGLHEKYTSTINGYIKECYAKEVA